MSAGREGQSSPCRLTFRLLEAPAVHVFPHAVHGFGQELTRQGAEQLVPASDLAHEVGEMASLDVAIMQNMRSEQLASTGDRCKRTSLRNDLFAADHLTGSHVCKCSCKARKTGSVGTPEIPALDEERLVLLERLRIPVPLLQLAELRSPAGAAV